MAGKRIIFYEKPGCATNARQKKELRDAGYEIEPRDILTTAWSSEMLLGFFGAAPVSDWFNKAAPAVKAGAIDPAALSAEDALAALCADPILIRRPLLEVEGQRALGFDNALTRRLLADAPSSAPRPNLSIEGCSHPDEDEPPCNRHQSR